MAIEETYLNIIKGSYKKPTTISEKLKAFPLHSGKRQGCPLLPLLKSSHNNLTRKRYKRYLNWKVRGKTVTVADNMILYKENPKVSP